MARWLGEAAALPVISAAALNRLLFSAEQELAADRAGLTLCHDAGFDLRGCLALFDHLAKWEETVRALGDSFPADWLTGSTPFRTWLRERLSGYPFSSPANERRKWRKLLETRREPR